MTENIIDVLCAVSEAVKQNRRIINTSLSNTIRLLAEQRQKGVEFTKYDDLVGCIKAKGNLQDKAFIFAMYQKRRVRDHLGLLSKQLKDTLDSRAITITDKTIGKIVDALYGELEIYTDQMALDVFKGSIKSGDVFWPAFNNTIAPILGNALSLMQNNDFVYLLQNRTDSLMDFVRDPFPHLPPVYDIESDDFCTSTITAMVMCILATFHSISCDAGHDCLAEVFSRRAMIEEDIVEYFAIKEPSVTFPDAISLLTHIAIPKISSMQNPLTRSMLYSALPNHPYDCLITPVNGYTFGSQFFNYRLASLVGDLRKTMYYPQDCAAFICAEGMMPTLPYDIFATKHAFIFRQLALDYVTNSLGIAPESVKQIEMGGGLYSAILHMLDTLMNGGVSDFDSAIAAFPRTRSWLLGQAGRFTKSRMNEIVISICPCVLLSILNSCDKILFFNQVTPQEAVEFWHTNKKSSALAFMNHLINKDKSMLGAYGAQSGGHVGVVESVILDSADGIAAVIFMAYARDLRHNMGSEPHNAGSEGLGYDVRKQQHNTSITTTWLMTLRGTER